MNCKRLYILLFFLATIFVGCSNNDTNFEEEPLHGKWNLANVKGGLKLLNLDFSQGEVSWEFNLQNNTIKVENNIVTTGPKSINSDLKSGVYNFKISTIKNQEVLFVDNIKKGVVSFDNNNLLIDKGLASDGYILSFIK